MRTREKERYQKLLLQMKEDVLRELKHFETNQRDSAKEMAGEVSNFMTHPADMGSVMQEREKAFWLASHGREILMQINDALMRIENGTYGMCEACGQAINAERLSALPHTAMCLDCQEELEKQGRRK
jgi:RNA polymerase-binding protein DksA